MSNVMSYVRRSARVILVDSRERVLLFRFPWHHKRLEEGYFWITPGGGVDEGETLRAAAARELLEETGLAVGHEVHLPHVAFAEGFAKFDHASGIFRDDYFYYRVDAHDVDDSGQEEWERSVVDRFHWWTLDELRSPPERVVPPRLHELISRLVGGEIPPAPLRLEWHH